MIVTLKQRLLDLEENSMQIKYQRTNITHETYCVINWVTVDQIQIQQSI